MGSKRKNKKLGKTRRRILKRAESRKTTRGGGIFKTIGRAINTSQQSVLPSQDSFDKARFELNRQYFKPVDYNNIQVGDGIHYAAMHKETNAFIDLGNAQPDQCGSWDGYVYAQGCKLYCVKLCFDKFKFCKYIKKCTDSTKTLCDISLYSNIPFASQYTFYGYAPTSPIVRYSEDRRRNIIAY